MNAGFIRIALWLLAPAALAGAGCFGGVRGGVNRVFHKGSQRHPADYTTVMTLDAEPGDMPMVRRSSDPSPGTLASQRRENLRKIHLEMAYEMFEHGRREVAAQNYARAVEFFANAVARNPAEPVYWNDLGRAQFWTKNYADARASLEQANLRAGQARAASPAARRQAEEMRAQILCNLGDIDREEGKYEDARRQYSRALEFSPHLARIQFEMGDLAMREKNYLEARTRFNNTLQLDPGDIRAHWGLALQYHYVGDDVAAWEHVLVVDDSGEFVINEEVRNAILAGRDRQRANERRRQANTP